MVKYGTDLAWLCVHEDFKFPDKIDFFSFFITKENK